MKKILVLGAGQYQVKVIEGLKINGFYVAAADSNPRSPGRLAADAFESMDITNAAAVKQYAGDSGMLAIMPRNDFGVRSAASAARELGLTGLSEDAAELANHKIKMRCRWAEAELPQPRFTQVFSVEDCCREAEKFGYPVIIKPADCGGGSRGVVKIHSPKEVDEAFKKAAGFQYFSKDIILEEFISGTELTVDGLVSGSELHVLAISDKTHFASHSYCVASSLNFSADLSPADYERVEFLAGKAVRTLGLDHCPFHIEMLIHENGLYLVELSARGGGGHIFSTIVPWVSSVDYAGQYARLLLKEPSRFKPLFKRGAVFHFLWAPPGRVVSTGDVKKARAMDGIADAEILVKPGDMVKEIQQDPQRLGFVVALGANRQTAADLARAAESIMPIKTE